MRRRGVNSAWQVERALLDHPAIEEIALVDVRGELGEDEIKTFVREAQGADLPPEVLMQWCPPGGLIFNGPASSTSWAISCAPGAAHLEDGVVARGGRLLGLRGFGAGLGPLRRRPAPISGRRR